MSSTIRKTYKSIGDILALVESIHRKIRRHYAEKEHLSEDPRVNLLLDYIDRQEKNHQKTISRYRREASGGVLDTYLQYMPDEIDDLQRYAEWRPEGETNIHKVLSTVLEFNSVLNGYYRRVAEMAPSESVRELFENLAEIVEEKERDEVRQALEAGDI